jgi:hypothetical protein
VIADNCINHSYGETNTHTPTFSGLCVTRSRQFEIGLSRYSRTYESGLISNGRDLSRDNKAPTVAEGDVLLFRFDRLESCLTIINSRTLQSAVVRDVGNRWQPMYLTFTLSGHYTQVELRQVTARERVFFDQA